jgi:UDP-glucose 4-epimerase
MRVLLTGGAGFIGSWVAEKYLEKGFDVIVVDNLSTGKKEFVSKKAKFYEIDIRDKEKMEKIFKENKIEIVNHHAAQASVSFSIKEPYEDFLNNIYGSMNLLELSKKYGVSKFIFASTGGAIYGEPLKNPVSEDAELNPISPYAFSKMIFEKYLDYYHKFFKINFVSLRYGNVYGPRQNPLGEAGVIAIFGYRMLKNEDCYIYGDGEQVRDFVYIDDVVEANLKATEFLLENENVSIKINIGMGKPVSINQVFEIFAEKTNYKKKPIYAPKREGEVYKIYLDTRRAKEILKWEPKVNFEDGIEKVIEYFKNERN